jgi:DNA-binding NtrC family response regulator
MMQICCFEKSGKLLGQAALHGAPTSWGATADCDNQHPAFGQQVFFVMETAPGSNEYSISVEHRGKRLGDTTLKLGSLKEFKGFIWTAVAADEGEFAVNRSHLLHSGMQWLRRTLQEQVNPREAAGQLLHLIIEETIAKNCMVVIGEGDGFNLFASANLTRRETEDLWGKIPADIREQVLRSDARIILPDGFRASTHDTTLFIRGTKTLAGFPVIFDGRLLGILFIGFENLFHALSAEMQSELEDIAQMLGILLGFVDHEARLNSAAIKLSANHTNGRLMVGASPDLDEVYHLVEKLSPVDVPILITGETGTGKELTAKEIHRKSNRRNGPYIVVNAAALPESLIESELFGYRKGSFTGALSDHCGLIEQADQGTLFLDEIGELPPGVQAKLLRTLQDRCIQRIGEPNKRAVDFRLVSATHRDLEELVKSGQFRQDLFYRIAGASIQLPPLRARRADILPLADHFKQLFLSKHGLPQKEWAADSITYLTASDWPGNIRELENAVYRACVMSEGSVIRAKDFSAKSQSESGLEINEVETLGQAKEAWMRSYLQAALKKFHGHRHETARALGIGERTLFRYIDQYGLKDSVRDGN